MRPETKFPDACIDEIAARQHGVVTRKQLLEAELTARMIFRRVARQRLVPLHRGVYRVGPVVSPYACEIAAVLACGEGAVVSGWSAAALWRLPPPPRALTREGHTCVFVTMAGRDCGRRPGIRLRRVRMLDASEVTRRHGVPVTTAARTLLDIAADLARLGLARELEQAVGHALRERLTTAAEMESLLERHSKRRGAALLRQVLGTETAVTRSQSEERLLAQIRDARLPSPRVNVVVAGHMVDFHWPAQRLVVEVDGFRYHGQRDRFENDRARDLDLAGERDHRDPPDVAAAHERGECGHRSDRAGTRPRRRLRLPAVDAALRDAEATRPSTPPCAMLGVARRRLRPARC